MLKRSPATKRREARCSSRRRQRPPRRPAAASIAAWSRSASGVRTRPQNTVVISATRVVCCQSIHMSAAARVTGSSGHRLPAAVAGREIAHAGVELPDHDAVVLDRRDPAVGVQRAIGVGVEAAEGAARVDPLMRQTELPHGPHHLLDVDRVGATPDPEHDLSPSPIAGCVSCDCRTIDRARTSPPVLSFALVRARLTRAPRLDHSPPRWPTANACHACKGSDDARRPDHRRSRASL